MHFLGRLGILAASFIAIADAAAAYPIDAAPAPLIGVGLPVAAVVIASVIAARYLLRRG